MSLLKVLVIGKGGREHALAWKIQQSPLVEKVFVAPGNVGMLWDKISLVDISETNFVALIDFVKQKNISFCVVGPEAPLAEGICDEFRKHGISVVGASRKAAQLEASKNFCKQVLQKASLKTADFKFFTNPEQAKNFILSKPWDGQIVVKADGLAAGKGVVVCSSVDEAITALNFVVDLCADIKDFAVVVEERLIGTEFSAFALCNDLSFVDFSSACDYKRLSLEEDAPNTGGMGAYAPVEWLSEADKKYLQEEVFHKTLIAMKEMNCAFNGFLFAGLMKTKKGIYVLEFNVRFGDPETQCIMPLIAEDIVPYLQQAAELKNFPYHSVQTFDQTSVYVVQAAKGYPHGPIEKSQPISLDESIWSGLEADKMHLFFAGVSGEKENLKTNGGRVLGLNALAPDRQSARDKIYHKMNIINFPNNIYREDIGQ